MPTSSCFSSAPLISVSVAAPNNNDGSMNDVNTTLQVPRAPRESVYCFCFKCRQELYEVLICFSVFALGKAIPVVAFDWLYSFEIPIPYQTTSTGDVLLELDLNYKFISSETVPDWLAVILCIFLPLMIFISVGYRSPRTAGDVHASLCFFFVTVGISWLLTDCIKIYAGQLRPNFYKMCEFDKDTLQCESDNKHLIRESRRSFPSGHASLAFSSMTALSLYFLGKVGIQRTVHLKRITLAKRLLYLASFLPILLAVYISTSRVHDFWHHPADIVAGSMIGIGCAFFAHGMWYVSCVLWNARLSTTYNIVTSNHQQNISAQLCNQVPLCIFGMVRMPTQFIALSKFLSERVVVTSLASR